MLRKNANSALGAGGRRFKSSLPDNFFNDLQYPSKSFPQFPTMFPTKTGGIPSLMHIFILSDTGSEIKKDKFFKKGASSFLTTL